jgi:hypothetical protein
MPQSFFVANGGFQRDIMKAQTIELIHDISLRGFRPPLT